MTERHAPLSADRRRFLALTGALGLGLASGGLLLPRAARAEAWQNWSGGQKARPAGFLFPDSEAALAKAIRPA